MFKELKYLFRNLQIKKIFSLSQFKNVQGKATFKLGLIYWSGEWLNCKFISFLLRKDECLVVNSRQNEELPENEVNIL